MLSQHLGRVTPPLHRTVGERLLANCVIQHQAHVLVVEGLVHPVQPSQTLEAGAAVPLAVVVVGHRRTQKVECREQMKHPKVHSIGVRAVSHFERCRKQLVRQLAGTRVKDRSRLVGGDVPLSVLTQGIHALGCQSLRAA